MRKTESGLYYGNVGGRILDVATRLTQDLSGFRTGSVRRLDSGSAPSHILSILRRFGIDARIEADSVFLSGSQICLVAQKLFCGFDEVWLWKEKPRERQFSSGVILTSDAVNLNDGLPANVENAMWELGCSLALGDGCGLNYVTTDHALADEIEQRQGVRVQNDATPKSGR